MNIEKSSCLPQSAKSSALGIAAGADGVRPPRSRAFGHHRRHSATQGRSQRLRAVAAQPPAGLREPRVGAVKAFGAIPFLAFSRANAVARSDRLRNDLLHIAGAGWERSLPLLASGVAMPTHREAAAGDGLRLVIACLCSLFRRPQRRTGPQETSRASHCRCRRKRLTLYDFPGFGSQALKDEMRDAIDRARTCLRRRGELVAEAIDCLRAQYRVSRARCRTWSAATVVRIHVAGRNLIPPADYWSSRVACQIR